VEGAHASSPARVAYSASINSYLRFTDAPLQIAVFPFQFTQPCAVWQLGFRFVARVLIPVALHPAAEGRFVDLYLARDLNDRREDSTTILAASSLNSGE
jgi:hypothetical protein